MAQINLLTEQTHIENRLVVAKGEGGESGMDWEFGDSRCKLLHLEWIIKKKKKGKQRTHLLFQTNKRERERSFHPGSGETNLASNHKDAGSIPGLALWVEIRHWR